MGAREDIAAAASTVAGVTVTPKYRQTLKPLQGFVKWSGRRPSDNGLGWMDDWQVWVALSTDVARAEEWLEANLQALIDAADSEAIVTNAVPAELVLGANSVNGLIIECSRAAGS